MTAEVGEQRSAPTLQPVVDAPRSLRYRVVVRPARAVGWARARWIVFALYIAALLVYVTQNGVPTGQLALSSVIIIGLLDTALGRSWRQALQVLLDWLPFTAVLEAYDRTRGVADGLGLPLHEVDILDAEKWLFGGIVPAVWLQQHLYTPGTVRWYDALCTLVYTSHFLATPILAAVLWARRRTLWIGYISRVILLSVAGLITYCLFPEAPPWLAARDGLTAPVARLSARGWVWLHAGNINTLLANTQRDGANPVAAMPSLHTAFATLVAIVVITQLRSKWRWLAVLYPLAMAFTLVYTGEHYVIDLVVGVLYALAAHFAMNVVEAWWAARRARRAAPTAPPERAQAA